MEIHKPRPWRGWREFLKEYFIIVVGVLTALGAEQLVQEVEWERRVRHAEADMHAELHENLQAAFARLATVNCSTPQFAGMRQALMRNRDSGAPLPVFDVYHRGTARWTDDAWEAARSLQLTGHIKTDQMRGYSRAYAMAQTFTLLQRREQDLRPTVDTLTVTGPRISEAERDRVLLALQQLEEQSNRLDNVAFRFWQAAARVGVTLSVKERAEVVARQTSVWASRPTASCVADPTPWLSHGERASNWLASRSGHP